MAKVTRMLVFIVFWAFLSSFWGFFGHKEINRLAIFCLPPEMIGFYKSNIDYLRDAAVNPDRRRLAVVNEAPRHYIDLDHYRDTTEMPRFWKDAVAQYPEDTLLSYGIAPWHVYRMYQQLRDAFLVKDPGEILRLSAELGHYIGDANVPLHTTENYNGQLTNQHGIHGFWESRLPELYSDGYSFFVGRATYLTSPQHTIWEAVDRAHAMVDSVLLIERTVSQRMGDRKYAFETRNRQTIKVYSREFSEACHRELNGMVERQMRTAVKMVADFWYTAWVDAGQPSLVELLTYQPTQQELEQRRRELWEWRRDRTTDVRPHESEN